MPNGVPSFREAPIPTGINIAGKVSIRKSWIGDGISSSLCYEGWGMQENGELSPYRNIGLPIKTGSPNEHCQGGDPRGVLGVT